MGHDLERRTVLGFRVAIKVFRSPGANAGRTLSSAPAGIGSSGLAGAAGAAGRRPSFVLVHGIGVSSRYFHPLAALLAEHGDVHAVDLPGYGESPRVRRDVTLADHAAVVAEVVRMHGLVDPVIVGHSMGAQIVAQLAVDQPGIADRIVLIGPTLDPRKRGVVRAGLALGRDTLREPLMSNAVVLGDYFLRCGIPYYLRQLPHLIGDRDRGPGGAHPRAHARRRRPPRRRGRPVVRGGPRGPHPARQRATSPAVRTSSCSRTPRA
ncbi:alpha/beta fold hydrolase [Clavibacter zhangzhiyongii]|uniref:alpha/beta fold hydrolase n=1 Tax=Clavibacter zhangzhiyongii TaxID=2768071 RepID=UPI0039E12AED